MENQDIATTPTIQGDEESNIENRIGIAIRDIGIPPRPTVLLEIDQEMSKDEPDFSYLAKILSADVALSAALLKTTNSPFFGFDKKIRSVPEAMLVLGLKLVVRTIASISLRKAFEHIPDMERFWDESGTTARVSGWLAKRLRKCCWVRPEDAYTFGLFRDCGIPVLMSPFPEYRSVLSKANAEPVARFTDVENQMISVNHAEMGALLAASWLLPNEIVEAIRYHHDLDVLVGQEDPDRPAIAVPLVAITLLAEHLIHERTGMGKSFEWQKVAGAATTILNIDAARISELFEECHEAMAGEND